MYPNSPADTTRQAQAQASLKITLSRKIVVRVLAVFVVAGLSMIDLWSVALFAGSGADYATTFIVFNLLSFILAIALGTTLWVLADR
jgi:hypothetical protein